MTVPTQSTGPSGDRSRTDGVPRRVQLLALLTILTALNIIGTGCRPRFQTMNEIRQRYSLPSLPTAADHPDADAVVILSTIDTELYTTDDGLHTDQVIHRIVRVFQNTEEHSVVDIDLFPGEELVDLEARIHDPEGRIIPVAREEVDLGRVAVPLPGSEIPPGDTPREEGPGEIEKNTVRLRFAGLTPGSSYEYRYRLRRAGPYLYDSWAVQEYDPVLYTHYTLTVPKGLYDAEGNEWDWRYRYYRCARIGAPEVFEQANVSLGYTETYKWTLRDVTGFTPEPRMPPHEEYLAFARFAHTAWQTWDEVTSSYWRNHLAEALEPDDEVAQAASEILDSRHPGRQGTSGNPAVSLARREVATITRYVQTLPAIDLELGQGSLTPTRPRKILSRGRADAKDKAILLVALLREAGHQADPALIVTRDHGPLDVQFPNWSFNHMLVLVELDGEQIWIDPTVRHYPLGELPWRCEKVEAVIVRGEGRAEVRTTPQPEAGSNEQLSEIRIVVGPEGGADGEVELVIDGEPGSLLLERLDRAVDRQTAIRGFCETEIHRTYPDADVSTPLLRETSPGRALVSFSFRTDELLVTDDVIPHLAPPPMPFDAGIELIGQVERRYPVENGYPAKWTRRLSIDLAASPFRMIAVPSPIDIRDREIAFSSRYELRGDTQLQSEETLVLHRPRMLTRVYRIARDILDAQEMAGATSVLLGRNP